MGVPKYTESNSKAARSRRRQAVANKSSVALVDGELVASDYRDSDWFKDLQREILTEIARLKVCTIGQLLRGKFAEYRTSEKHRYFAQALDDLSGALNQTETLPTFYSLKIQFPNEKPKGHHYQNWRIAPKQADKVYPMWESVYGDIK